MRVRNKPWADDFIKDHPEYIVEDPEKWIGKWSQKFSKDQPIHIEIGMGKGKFIIEMAKKFPNINFIGVEIQKSVIALALKKLVSEKLDNVILVHTDGAGVNTFFNHHEISTIYLNFSDPWPKKRHAKRRLTSPKFLDSYAEVLKKDAPLVFKTDNRGLFEYSLVTFNNYGMHFDYVSLDLHNSPENEDNVETEYENKFSKKGPIYKAIVRFNNKKED
ncbi:tRNA (guanosine(46)-N7)-methyltransferase TrmB [Apilactobacillus xinyiensis]|uniref:tRNA (guanine-N(7)-)-methyltransferase n=1 Tax=Apilactobacillus xinyiensis TaxID=2841032 RepID=A0ABT0I080_9LACO|nr:tRNA (guanosine(46)-N7)-methyltransferase TrmB [Apilactobacillus xinyiensis]MCK8624241.1 tRNA (guanosine(46)-N7)-methyltransferase TrmB [Apilactobacillus xinyiensis]MCL0318459.1 tRNA (guanosine(46)-N7)-methyltransferase TrmB [Apilactobacillus xinyiensis]MCL0329518.1 tRNA (guanosine(46)-N7)-methyltransferase TrmB [Apilactobacillus xinyiensis]